MKRRQLLLRLFGLPLVGSLVYAAVSRSKNEYEPVLANSPISNLQNNFPEPSEGRLLRFAAIADTGVGSRDQYAVANAMFQTYQAQPFPLVLMAGDNIYPHGEISLVTTAFEQPYEPLLRRNVKFYAVLGNHDIIKSNNGLDQINYPLFNMRDRYYSFQQGVTDQESVEFFALDTNHNAAWDIQLAWLDQQLAQSTALWKIVFGHHPIYSSGRHGGKLDIEAKLAPIFAKHQVSIYLCGHDHGYERFMPIDGTTYIVNGGGGAPLYVFGKSNLTAVSSSQFSFMTFDVYRDKIITKAIATNGKVFDRAIITKPS
ncbi:metallophosphoesterase [Pseudanabaena mucicola]|uniref:Metallophosphoesterase n=1 Tax=Pseudanabaena mucicola FACHB-723 TaxID=2692860 RepID=A0ABR7ZXC6_9CYAN|nr:metallophosphoesterase [Pseudanabaena mucicola]MBD2188613.1 metallophosphoesterase [Pseudanabaena mucicola FACHB-723]